MRDTLGIVLLNLGGPDSLEAVEPFLFNLFSDPDIIDFPGSFLFRTRLAKLISTRRAPGVIKQYSEIGGKSPLKEYTLGQAKLLEDALRPEMDAKVYVAMRYWNPSTRAALDEVIRDGISNVVLLPLYPQLSLATTTSSVKEWKSECAASNADIKWGLIESYFEQSTYIAALVERVREGLERFDPADRDEVTVLFSAHGTPMKLVRSGDPYSAQIGRTVAAVMQAGEFTQHHELCYQSKVGPLKWLTPSTPDTVAKLAAQGKRHLLLVPVSFASDHLETLFELGIEYRRRAMAQGVVQYEVTEGLNYSPLFIKALAELVIDHVGRASASGSSASRQ